MSEVFKGNNKNRKLLPLLLRLVLDLLKYAEEAYDQVTAIRD